MANKNCKQTLIKAYKQSTKQQLYYILFKIINIKLNIISLLIILLSKLHFKCNMSLFI
jgi:hypothetical protein